MAKLHRAAWIRSIAGTVIIVAALCGSTASAEEYRVGPGQAYASIGAVRWYALQPGDTVYIHYRPEPYREKFQISGRGTPTAWIRVLGVPGPNGELPVISGANATTSSNMRFRWPDANGPNAIQWSGVVHIAPRANEGTTAPPLPGYIEIANLQIQDAQTAYTFTAENGTVSNYDSFSACIYARSVQHLIVRANVLTNCGLGFFNWSGSGNTVVDAPQIDTVIKGNYFVNNGVSGHFGRHQLYTESDGVTIEENRFGTMKEGAQGSQIKDRSVGTVIRYNHILSSQGWMLDLVEPENSYSAWGSKPSYRQAFVYGNVMINRTLSSNIVHWNEDNTTSTGRATLQDGRLFFYHNTVVIIANQTDRWNMTFFNTTWGAGDCAPTTLPGVIDVRNNILAVLPRTPGAVLPNIRLAYCTTQHFVFGRNVVTSGWTLNTTGSVTGVENIVSVPSSTALGFLDLAGDDVRIASNSPAAGVGGALASEVINNVLSLDLSPTRQYLTHQSTQPRSNTNDVGGYSLNAGASSRPTAPGNLRIIR